MLLLFLLLRQPSNVFLKVLLWDESYTAIVIGASTKQSFASKCTLRSSQMKQQLMPVYEKAKELLTANRL